MEWSQVLGGEGRGLGQRGCKGRHGVGAGTWLHSCGRVWAERSARSSNTVGCSQEGPRQKLSLDPSLSTTSPRGQLSGFCHSCLAGWQDQQGGQHYLPVAFCFPTPFFPSPEMVQAHPFGSPSRDTSTATGKSKVQGTRLAASPAVRASTQGRGAGAQL